MAVMDYRTRDGLASYAFSIEFEPDIGWRVYIVFRLLYQDGGEKPKWSYEATDDNDRCYVNWPAKLDNLGDARTVALLWAENAEYHAQGLTRSSGDEVNKATNPRAVNRRKSAAA
ncbi:MAG TPA: hypothetical protein VIY28_20525 [Pseudonocardiaceae bacterium]